MARQIHRDLEFHVEGPRERDTFVTRRFPEAAAEAVARSVAYGAKITLDVVAFSPAAARAWGGDELYQLAREDPELSVLERIVIHADSRGHVR
jgi:hypothetical protein